MRNTKLAQKQKVLAIREQQIMTDMEKYRPFILKLSWQYWQRLPIAVKAWIDPDDLIAEVYVYVISRVQDTYNSKRASKMTFLYTGVNNLLLNHSLAHQTKKRLGWSVPIEDAAHLGKTDQRIDDMEAIEALHRVYRDASPQLKEYIAAWFGARRPRVQWSIQARQAYREFRDLALKERLSKDGCRRLLRNGVWLPLEDPILSLNDNQREESRSSAA